MTERKASDFDINICLPESHHFLIILGLIGWGLRDSGYWCSSINAQHTLLDGPWTQLKSLLIRPVVRCDKKGAEHKQAPAEGGCWGHLPLDLRHPPPVSHGATCCSSVSGGGWQGKFSRTEELQPLLISYLSNWFSWRCDSPPLPPPSICIRTPQRSNVRHKVKHRRATWRFLMRLPCSFNAQYLSFSPPPPSNALWSSPPSFNRARSSYHQSAFSSRGLRQCHAGLCVLPDRTTVPSGYPYTSSLTPLIFTGYRENWKIHGSLKWAHRSQTSDCRNQRVFYQGLQRKLSCLSISNHSSW